MAKANKKLVLSSLQEDTISNKRAGDMYFVNMKTTELMFRTIDGKEMVWQKYRREILNENDVEIPEPVKVAKTKSRNYIDKEEMLLEILKSKEQGELTERAIEMFILLGKRVIKRLQHKYKTQAERDDCLQTGMYHIFKSWYKFDSRMSDNPFSYYTQIFKTGTADGYNTLNKKKGDPDNDVSVMSYTSSNEGKGMFNII